MTREEAIRRIKAWNLDADDMEVLSEVIPELRESDNKIHRKWILEYLYDGLRKSDEQFKGQFKSAIDWLEKQKEQPEEELVYRLNGLMQEYIKEGENDAEKEHRFKCYRLFWNALEDADFFEQRDYRKLYEDIAQSEWFKKAYVGKSLGEEFEQKDKDKNLDEIAQDYVDGVKEYNPECTWDLMQTAVCYGYHYREQKEQNTLEYLPKEKINDIMSKLTNLSYSILIPINSEEYKKIGEITSDVCDLLDYPIEKQKEQKPADEQFPPLEGLDAIKAKYYDNGFKNGFDEGVESVKQAEWSEEDRRKLNRIYEILGNAADDKGFLTSKRIIGDNEAIELQDFLKSLKDRGNFPKSNTNSPSEWSEEDEKMRKSIIWVLESFVSQADCESNPSFTCSYPTYYKEIDWLKSLRPSWKPSKEQMEALSETIAFAPDTFKPKCTLVTLQDDLKKLMDD